MTFSSPPPPPRAGATAHSPFALKRLWLGDHRAAEDKYKVKSGDSRTATGLIHKSQVKVSDPDSVGLQHSRGKTVHSSELALFWKRVSACCFMQEMEVMQGNVNSQVKVAKTRFTISLTLKLTFLLK